VPSPKKCTHTYLILAYEKYQIKYYTWKKIIIFPLQYRDLTTTLL